MRWVPPKDEAGGVGRREEARKAIGIACSLTCIPFLQTGAATLNCRNPRLHAMVSMPGIRRAGVMFLLVAFIAGPAKGQDVGIQEVDQSTPTVLYMHIADARNDFPINTQPPDDRFNQGASFGLFTQSQTCFDDPTGQAGLLNNEYHTYYGYSTPGYVEYDFQEDGLPRYHTERGISFDVRLDTAEPFTLYWYLETQYIAGDNQALPLNPNQHPVVVPNVKVIATMREGDAVSIGHEALNSGAVIASGETEPMLLEPNAENHAAVDGRHVYEFAVPMTFEKEIITRDEAYNIRIDVAMELPVCPNTPEEHIMPNLVAVHTSPDHRPRMELSIMNPIRIEYIHPQFVGEEMVIHTSFNSPWGNYDVDEAAGGIEVGVEGPSKAASLVRAAFVQRHHDHFHHQEPVDVTYIWPYKNDNAQKGEYLVHVSVWNDQHTAQAKGIAKFDIASRTAYDDQGQKVANQNQDPGKDSPAAGLLILLGSLGAAAVVGKRRR